MIGSRKEHRVLLGICGIAVSIVVFGWILVPVVVPAPDPIAPEFDNISAFETSDIVKIDAWLEELVEQSDFPSLSVAIVRSGEIVYQRAIGFENTWANRPATTNTMYHVASVTKAFTASLAMLLHDRGVVDLDEPVVSYLPSGTSISVTPELGATITLRQLATHTSGLPRGVPGRVQSVEGRYALEPEWLYALLADVRLEFDPGTDDLYSNLGFGLLGHALELAAEQSLDQLLKELICEPLNLEHTTIHIDENHSVATGYSTPPQLPESHSYRQRLAGSGGLVTSAGDLARFLAAHLQTGLFSDEMLAELHSPTELSDGTQINRALGWSIDARSPAGLILSKNGGRGNAGAWIGFAPDDELGVAVITNIGAPDVDPIGRWLLERAVPGGWRPVTEHGFARVALYSGVRWEDNRPIVQVNDRWHPLVSIDGLPIDRIMAFAEEEFGDRARKRFAEDLPELMSKMGHEIDWLVTLGLEMNDGRVEAVNIRMTEENRSRVREQ